MLFILQGDRRVLDLLHYILNQTSNKKGSGGKAVQCWVEKVDIPAEKIDDNIKSAVKDAPKLYLFFKGDKFDVAEVSADKCIIHLQAGDTTNALMCYLSTYFVFHVGYPPAYTQLLGFLQQVLLGVPYDGKKGVHFNDFMHKYDTASKTRTDSKQYKTAKTKKILTD